MKNKKIPLQKCGMGIRVNFSHAVLIGVILSHYLLSTSSLAIAAEGSGMEDDTVEDEIETLLDTDTEEMIDEKSICPSLEEYEETKQSVVVTLINDTHVLVDWSNLWPDLTWRDCISQLVLLIDGKEVKTISNVMKNASELEIDVCETHKVKIKGLLAEGNEQHVFSNDETIHPPEKSFFAVHSKINEYITTNTNQAVKASYFKHKDLQTNITCVRIEAKYSDLIEQSVCNKIKSTEIVIRKASESEEKEWMVKNQIETALDTEHDSNLFLDEIICGLSDYCSAYEIGLRVKETTKPDLTDTDLVVPLTSIGPIDFDNLDLAKAVNIQDLKLEGPNGLELLYAEPKSIALQWKEDDERCFSGYVIHLKNEKRQDMQGTQLFICQT